MASSPNVIKYDMNADFSTDEALHLARVGNLSNINDFLIALSASVRRNNADFQCLEIAYNAQSKSIGYGITRRGAGKKHQIFPHIFTELGFEAGYPTHFLWTIKGVFSAISFRYSGSYKANPGPRDRTVSLSMMERKKEELAEK